MTPSESAIEPAVTPETPPADQPLLAVVKGEPTAEELAALTAVVLSLGSGEPAEPAKPGVRHWIRRQQLKLAPKPGPGSWKRSHG
ncbi:MAG: acyl-CoA carboxylase subunit epsilon [Arthrobacter sp.]|nr:acyl-CoA carboxylase subunit epsilon [Arthrobacter sp.]